MSATPTQDSFVLEDAALPKELDRVNVPAVWDELRFPSKRGGDNAKWLCITTDRKNGSKEFGKLDKEAADVMGTHTAEALFSTLSMPYPSLVVSVTGFARTLTDDELPPKQREDIAQALVKVAQATRTCFVTGGVSGHAKLCVHLLLLDDCSCALAPLANHVFPHPTVCPPPPIRHPS